MESVDKNKLIRDLSLGIIGWYDFNRSGKILYIGEKSDPVPEYLIERGYDVKSEETGELDLSYAETHSGEYSYAICIADPEKTDKPIEFLKALCTTISDEGHLLLGMNNRLGIRYFCGDRDPYTDRYFDGIEGYARNDRAGTFNGRAFSKSEIKEMLNAGGFKHSRFYSVLPGLDTAAFIFSEDYIPNEDLSNRVFPSYNDPASVFMKEQALYGSLIKEGLFHSMANAFLIDCTVSGEIPDIKQVTSSLDRGRENALFTIIRGDGLVEKRAPYPEGKKRFDAMRDNEEDLKAHGIKVIEASIKDNTYVMPYEKSKLTQVYLKELLYRDKDKFLNEMDRFRDLVLSSSERETLPDGTEVFKKGYFDLVPLNSFIKDGEFVFFDQEFCIENLPVKVMALRLVASFYFGDPAAEKELPREVLHERYGLTEELQRWRTIERGFLDSLLNLGSLSEFYALSRTNDILISKRRKEIDSHAFNIFDGIKGKRLYLFGSGKYAAGFLDSYKDDIPVCGILDNNREKAGSEISGIKIFTPEILKDMDPDSFKVLICVKDHQDIVRQLKESGVKNYSIYDPEILSDIKPRKTVLTESLSDTVHEKHYHIGYVAGAFDMFHIGHLNLLRRAKERCDYLIAGVMSDERMFNLKNKYPVIPCRERMQVVAGCRYADRVEELPADRAGIRDAYHMFHFDCMFSGDDHADNPGWLAEREYLRSQGSDIVFVPYTKDTSSSEIRERMKKEGK